jgi:Flp pilus assembly protein CpaB
VTPDQANKLDLGQNRGTLHLALRNPEDHMAAKAQPATLMGLQFHSEVPWVDQAKSLIEALTKKLPDKGASKKEVAKAADISPPLEIRTLRGTHFGVVRVEPVVSPDSGR